MLRWIRSRGRRKVGERKILFVSITGERCNCFVPRNTDEPGVCWGCCARYDASNVWPTFWIITAVVLPPSPTPRKVLFVFIKPAPVWSPHGNRPLGFPWICDRIKLLYCQAGGEGGWWSVSSSRKPVHPPKFTRINQVLVTRESKTRWRSKMGNGTRFHGIPLRIRPPVIGSNARILKIRNTPPFWNTVRSIMSRDFRLSLRCYGSRESASINLRINRRNASYARVQVEKRIGFWLVLYSPYGWERERERGQRERPRVYRRYQRYWVEGRRELGPRVYF